MSMRESIYERLTKRRQRLGWSVSELARKAGVANRTIHRLEDDPSYSLGLDCLERLCVAMEINPEELFDESAVISRSELREMVQDLTDALKKLS